MNRMVGARTAEWARWVIFLALGRILGKLRAVFDRSRVQWILFKDRVDSCYFFGACNRLSDCSSRACRDTSIYGYVVMLTQALVGILGFWFHIQANLLGHGHNLFAKLAN